MNSPIQVKLTTRQVTSLIPLLDSGVFSQNTGPILANNTLLINEHDVPVLIQALTDRIA